MLAKTSRNLNNKMCFGYGKKDHYKRDHPARKHSACEIYMLCKRGHKVFEEDTENDLLDVI